MNVKIKINLYEIRTEQGLSIRALEKMSGVPRSTINDTENGKKIPRLDTICMLAKSLEVRLEELITFH